jgi:hypothetical protein
MPDPQTSYANGSFTTALSVSGSNNITPIMKETLGIMIMGIISLVLFFELRRVNDLNRKLLSRPCEGGCNCGCHKQDLASNP